MLQPLTTNDLNSTVEIKNSFYICTPCSKELGIQQGSSLPLHTTAFLAYWSSYSSLICPGNTISRNAIKLPLNCPQAGQLVSMGRLPSSLDWLAGFGLTLTGLLHHLTWVTNYPKVVGSPVCNGWVGQQAAVGCGAPAPMHRRTGLLAKVVFKARAQRSLLQPCSSCCFKGWLRSQVKKRCFVDAI